MYVLEIMRFAHDGVEDKRRASGVFEHVGYVTEPNDRPYAHGPTGAKRIREFRTKAAAAAAYDRLFVPAGMRALNAHGTWISDWCEETRLAYCVREQVGVAMSEKQIHRLDHWGRELEDDEVVMSESQNNTITLSQII